MRKYPAVVLVAFVVAGIVLADLVRLPAWLFLSVTLAGFSLGLYLYRFERVFYATIFFAVALAAFSGFHYRFTLSGPQTQLLHELAERRQVFEIYGTVADWPDLRSDHTELRIALDSLVDTRLYRVHGNVLLKVSDTTTALQRGDRILFEGRIYPLPPPSQKGFNYRRYLSLKGISGFVYLPTLLDVQVDRRSTTSFLAFADVLRSAITESLHKNLSPISSALASGFLIGDTRNIPPDIYKLFRDSGTLHLLAVSGSNVALVLVFFSFLLRPLGLRRRYRTLVLLLLLLLFTAVSHNEPSVVRASIMATLVLLAREVQRRFDLNNIIAVAALVVLLVAPTQLYDVGFQLSFVTAWGLIFIVPRVTSRLSRQPMPRFLQVIIFTAVVSLVAQICSLPLIALYFRRIPVLTAVANLVIVPLVSLAVIAVLAVLIAHLFLPVFGLFVGSLVDPLLRLIVTALHFFGGTYMPVVTWPAGESGGLEPAAVITFYFLILLGVAAATSKQARRLCLVVLLLVLNGTAGYAILAPRRTHLLRIEAVSVPQGVGVIVQNVERQQTDLVISNIEERNYPSVARTLSSLLETRGIGQLRSLFVLAGNYTSVKEVLRSVGRRTDSVFFHQRLAPTVQDILAEDTSLARVPLTFFHSSSSLVKSTSVLSGYFCGPVGFELRVKEKSIVMVSEITKALPEESSGTASRLLIVGRKWMPSDDDIKRLSRQGWRQVICSRIEQRRGPSKKGVVPKATSVLPDLFYDLSRKGPLEI